MRPTLMLIPPLPYDHPRLRKMSERPDSPIVYVLGYRSIVMNKEKGRGVNQKKGGELSNETLQQPIPPLFPRGVSRVVFTSQE